MNELAHQKITSLPWNEFEDGLHAVTRGARRGTADEQAMCQYFGDAEFEELEQLAVRARAARARAPALCNVVLLPGIMRSNPVIASASGAEEVVWVSRFRLALAQAASRPRLGRGYGEARAFRYVHCESTGHLLRGV